MSDKKSKTVKKDEKEKQQDLFVFDPKEKELKIKEINKLKKIKEELKLASIRKEELDHLHFIEQNSSNRKHKILKKYQLQILQKFLMNRILQIESIKNKRQSD